MHHTRNAFLCSVQSSATTVVYENCLKRCIWFSESRMKYSPSGSPYQNQWKSWWNQRTRSSREPGVGCQAASRHPSFIHRGTWEQIDVAFRPVVGYFVNLIIIIMQHHHPDSSQAIHGDVLAMLFWRTQIYYIFYLCDSLSFCVH